MRVNYFDSFGKEEDEHTDESFLAPSTAPISEGNVLNLNISKPRRHKRVGCTAEQLSTLTGFCKRGSDWQQM